MQEVATVRRPRQQLLSRCPNADTAALSLLGRDDNGDILVKRQQ